MIILSFINEVNAQIIDEQIDNLQGHVSSLKNDIKQIKENILDNTFPIGSIFITTTYSTVGQVQNNLGGQWSSYGNGRNLVGFDSNDSDFNLVNKTGGLSSITLTKNNLPSHLHNIPSLSGSAASAGDHYHNLIWGSGNDPVSITYRSGTIKTLNITNYQWVNATSACGTNFKTTTVANHTHDVTTNASITLEKGLKTPNSIPNLEPYITVYIYQRIS